MTDKEYVKVYCCADCAHYDMKKHRCRNGAKDEGTGREHFYRDCRLGIHNENESVPIEVLDKIRAEIDSHCSDNRDRNDGLYIAMKIIDKYKAESENEE
jgi:hypothetical protein